MGKSRPRSDEKLLLRLAESVSDRASVDWEAELARDPERRETIERLRALQTLAAVHETAGRNGEDEPGLAAGAAASPATAEPAGLTVWGPLQILESLGRGGFGHVYRAFEGKLDREVALKLWRRREERSDTMRQMAEARALARLRHPSLPIVFGVGEHAGWVGMWTELVRGHTFEEILSAQGPLAAREAALVGVEICRALAAVHDAGLVHRDVKTANVMREESGRVVLLDFGLVVRANAPLEEHAAGTPSSMAPEALRGERVTPRSDLYSLGVLLYRLVTGAFPYEGGGAQEIADRQSRGERVSLRQRQPDLPAGFADIVERALEASPESRFSTAGAMEQALLSFLGRPAMDQGGGEAPAHALPRPLTRFVGRSDELTACIEAIREFRLTTLIGPGGSGKTRLAIRAAEAIAEEPGAWVGFADLSLVGEAESIAAEVRRALELPAGGNDAARDRLIQAIGGRSVLLVLDNCEHVLEPVAAFAESLLASCPGSKILATSRSTLRIPGENALAVPPLGLPPPSTQVTAAVVGVFDAVRLFVERARLVRSDFQLTDENAAAVAEICRQTDGLPLAIELAAARARALTPEEIRDRLPEALSRPDRGAFALSARHRTLEAAIRWSYDSLAEDERRWMDSLAVFAGSWSLSAAAQVCLEGIDELDALDAISSLIEKSLVTTAPPCLGASRYRYLETLRSFALERLRESGRHEELQRRHAAHFVALAEEADPQLWRAEQADWATRLEADHANFLAALAWLRDHPEHRRDNLRLAGALARFWTHRGHLSVGRHALEAALASPAADDDGPARARALMGAGTLAIYQSDHVAAQESLTLALALYRRLGDSSGVARTLVSLGLVAHDVSDYPAALECYRESLALYRELGDARGIGNILNNLGAIAWRQGEWDEARRLHEEVLALAVPDPGVRVLSLTNLGFVALHQGRVREAAARLSEALAGVRSHGLMRHAASILEATAATLSARRESAVAARLYAAANQHRRALGAPMEEAWRRAHEPMQEALARDLGPDRLEAESKAGRALAPERAIEEARRALDV